MEVEVEVDHRVAPWRIGVDLNFRVELRRRERLGSSPPHRKWLLMSRHNTYPRGGERGYGGAYRYESVAREEALSRSKKRPTYDYRVVNRHREIIGTYRKGFPVALGEKPVIAEDRGPRGRTYQVETRLAGYEDSPWMGFGVSDECEFGGEKSPDGSFWYAMNAHGFAKKRSREHPSHEYRVLITDVITDKELTPKLLATYRKGRLVLGSTGLDEPDPFPWEEAIQETLRKEEMPYTNLFWPVNTTRKGIMAQVDLHVDDYGSLEFDKDQLVTRLKERLAANEAERQAKRDKAAARNKEARDRIVDALDNPQFLVWLAGLIKSRNSEFDPASDAMKAKVAETWPDADADPPEEMDPDRMLRNAIDVYELAKDDTIKIAVTDNIYPYLARPKGAAETSDTPAAS